MKAERNATSGETRRTASNGNSVNRKLITKPGPYRGHTADHAKTKHAWIGSIPLSMTGSRSCSVAPGAAASTAPKIPSANPWTT